MTHTPTFSSLRINPDRMLDSFNLLAAVGANVLLQAALRLGSG